MKILYFSVIEQHAGWGAEWFLNEALESLGHETVCVDYREHRHRLGGQVEECGPVQAMLVQRGDRFPVELVRAARVPCFFLATELFHRRPDQHPLFRCDALSHVFVRTRGCASAIVDRGWQPASNVSILLSSFDPALHRKLPEAPDPDIDVLFLGGMTSRRRRILDALSDDLNVVVTKAFGEEMVRYFNRAKIVLNIHAEDHLDVETRIYEVLGSGGFLISERLAAECPFTQRELVQVGHPGELEEAIRYYLEHDDERREIAAAGYAQARRAHTYRARAEQLVSTIEPHVDAVGHRPFARDVPWYLFRATEGGQRVLSLLRRTVAGR